ncbi:MAG: TetR/AcrR family transcriptional regulator [Endozoicomonas sp.]|uniref:TetR/AcrR family transcriptional regulator n=1 Tax=Endozoicomonas sp. TaxID=1892382 RepID=UPI003D9B2012
MSKRNQILDAALILFMANGFEKTPTSAISKAAGVATGTLFHHFKTKEELISALYFDIKMDIRNRIFPSLSTTDDLKARLFALFESIIDWSLENPDQYHFMIQFSESAFISPNTRERVEEAFEEIPAMISEGFKQGVLHDLPEDLLCRQLYSLLMSSAGYLLDNKALWQQQNFRQSLLQSFWKAMARV